MTLTDDQFAQIVSELRKRGYYGDVDRTKVNKDFDRYLSDTENEFDPHFIAGLLVFQESDTVFNIAPYRAEPKSCLNCKFYKQTLAIYNICSNTNTPSIDKPTVIKSANIKVFQDFYCNHHQYGEISHYPKP